MDFEVIDCHVHPFLGPETNYSYFPDTGIDTPDQFVAETRRAGVARCCGSVIPKTPCASFAAVQALNRECLEFAARYPGFLLPGVHVHPSWPEESCQELEEHCRRGPVRWVGELVGYITGHPSYLGDDFLKIYDLIQELGLPVNIHGKWEECEAVATMFPKLNVVIAHPGTGRDDNLKLFALLKRHPNLHLDLSGTGVFRWGMLRHGIDVAGKEKFLFGSDFPICSVGMMLQGVLAEHLTDAEFEAVLSGNFKRLTGLA